MLVLDSNGIDNVWAMMKAGSDGAPSSGRSGAEVNGLLRQSAAALGQAHGLTERETQILALLAQGRTSPYISNELLIGVNTVNTHKRRIYQKLGVHDKQELIDMVAGFPSKTSDAEHDPSNNTRS